MILKFCLHLLFKGKLFFGSRTCVQKCIQLISTQLDEFAQSEYIQVTSTQSKK